MPETLTATFCERCGTRQEFRAPRALGPLRKTRGFIGGLKNYIGGSEALSEAMREGMQTQESAIAAAQLDAFHESIHLCIDCRQYTCNDCWNVEAGRCRTCAPVVGVDDLADRIAASLDGAPGGATGPLAEPSAVPVFDHSTAAPLPAESWPQADHEVYPATAANDDLPVYELAVLPAEEEPHAEPEPIAAEADSETAEPEPIAADATPEPPAPPLRVLAWDPDAPVLEPEPVAEVAPDPVAADADDEAYAAEAAPAIPFDAFDDSRHAPAAEAEFEPTPVAEPVAQETPEPQPAAQPEPAFPQIPERRMPRRSGPMRDRVVRMPAAIPPPAPPAERPPMRVAAEAEPTEVAARRAQLELLGLGDTAAEAAAAADAQVLPYRSRGASVSNREATAAAILWEASAREVDGVGVTVQSCDGCGLALSANARFCRRCGTRQAQSA